MYSSSPSQPTPDEALQILDRLQAGGHVLADLVQVELVKVRGDIHDETRTRVEGAGAVQEKRELEPAQIEKLISQLHANFDDNGSKFPKLHPEIQWTYVETALRASPNLLFGLKKMEETGGKVDVIAEDKRSFLFGDTSIKSPEGRRNVVFDAKAEAYLHKHFPTEQCDGNAVDMVQSWGADLMDEPQYRALQKLIPLDPGTSSWLKTPVYIRIFGSALFGYRHGEQVGVRRCYPYIHHGYGSPRATLRVPKVKA